MTTLRETVPLPARMTSLPKDHRGFVVPWFVDWHNGEPFFPAMDPTKLVRAIRQRLCWVCGQPLGRNMTFVVGPMCTINRTSAEPPSHLDCALYSVQVCPFMVSPEMGRVPERKYGERGATEPGGIMETRNPGAAIVWNTRDYTVVRTPTGPICRLPDPTSVWWWIRGRLATRAEASERFDDAVRLLRGHAQRLDGPQAEPTLNKLIEVARRYLPGE